MLPIDRCIILASILLIIQAHEWTKLNCPAPRSPTNGVSFIIDNGRRVQFHCHPGFKMIGSNLAECNRNKWTSLPPRCIPLSANQDPSTSNDDTTSSYSRTVFNWQQARTEGNEEPITVAYGAGSNRLPIINGLWGYPSHRNSRVLSIVSDPHHGNSVNAKELLEQEMNIAALRHQLEKDVMSSRHLQPKKESTTPSPYYSPYKINSDGYLVGIGGIKSHPVYYLGASADHKVDEYYKNTRIGPELAELRRKQIEEARNIQMKAANNRQRSQFQNTLTYGTKDIPVWKGRQSSGRYWSEETVYKPARVEMSKYAEQNRFFGHNPSHTPLIPKPIQKQTQRSLVFTTEDHFNAHTTTTRTPTSRNQPRVSNNLIQTLKDIKPTRATHKSFTPETIVTNVPTPPVLSSKQEPLPLIQDEHDIIDFASAKHEIATRNQSPIVNHTDSKTNNDEFDWPPEALWFKYPTTKRSTVITIRPSRRWTTRKSSKGHKPRGKRVNKNKNLKRKEKTPQVTHFSHGRVKSTGNDRAKS